MKKYKFKINGDKYKARIVKYKGDYAVVEVNGNEFRVDIETESSSNAPKLVRSQSTSNIDIQTPKVEKSQAGDVTAPIPGVIHKILVKPGDNVNEGDNVIILEAMKMESDINTNYTGKVKEILVKEGENVTEGQVLIKIGE